MRNVIFGGIGVVWGIGILLYGFFAGAGRGGYGAGQVVGSVFGFLIFCAGQFFLINGISNLGDDKPLRNKRVFRSKSSRSARAAAGLLFTFALLFMLVALGNYRASADPLNPRNPSLGQVAVKTMVVVTWFVIALVLVAIGVGLLHESVLPKTLHFKDDCLRLMRGQSVLGEIPYENMAGVKIITGNKGMASALLAFFAGEYFFGWKGGVAALAAHDPHPTLGIFVKLKRPDDPDTFWPSGHSKKGIEIRTQWQAPFEDIVTQLNVKYSRSKAIEGA